MRARRLRRPVKVREKLIRREERRLARLEANGVGRAKEAIITELARRKKKGTAGAKGRIKKAMLTNALRNRSTR